MSDRGPIEELIANPVFTRHLWPEVLAVLTERRDAAYRAAGQANTKGEVMAASAALSRAVTMNDLIDTLTALPKHLVDIEKEFLNGHTRPDPSARAGYDRV